MRHPVIPTTLFRTCTGCGAKIAARTPTTHCPTRDRAIAAAVRQVDAGHLPTTNEVLNPNDELFTLKAMHSMAMYGTATILLDATRITGAS